MNGKYYILCFPVVNTISSSHLMNIELLIYRAEISKPSDNKKTRKDNCTEYRAKRINTEEDERYFCFLLLSDQQANSSPDEKQ